MICSKSYRVIRLKTKIQLQEIIVVDGIKPPRPWIADRKANHGKMHSPPGQSTLKQNSCFKALIVTIVDIIQISVSFGIHAGFDRLSQNEFYPGMDEAKKCNESVDSL